eukprot:TRINITY_DN1619_c0_g1_i4.p1 TRINITY_DN1619_c0_g1~~TRINITY_DN1619_c0_g1_i4.p1  ORF type:complete len:378 (+),score=154.63 TRINITY_DN1619_c0_g1_i4:60-1136(+)
MASAQVLKTDMTELLRIRHPVLLAGMNNVSTARLAAAVSNAGGLGSIGGLRMTPNQLRKEISQLKDMLHDKTAFGVDLLLPQIGGSARKTNRDYTEGQLPELVEVIATSGARLFISAVGVPPKWVVERLHKAGIICMNMVGHPRHVEKAIAAGMDIMCCQGYEGGGHTGEVGTAALIPMCLDAAKGKTSAFTGKPIQIVAAGGIYDDRSMAAMLAMGAQAVWVGTRFIACEEATASKAHVDGVLQSGATNTIRTLIYTGRPLRTIKTPFVMEWENTRQEEIRELTSKGVVPYAKQRDEALATGKPFSIAKTRMLLAGQVAGSINSVLTAKQIVDSMTHGAARILQERAARIVLPAARL